MVDFGQRKRTCKDLVTICTCSLIIPTLIIVSCLTAWYSRDKAMYDASNGIEYTCNVININNDAYKIYFNYDTCPAIIQYVGEDYFLRYDPIINGTLPCYSTSTECENTFSLIRYKRIDFTSIIVMAILSPVMLVFQYIMILFVVRLT